MSVTDPIADLLCRIRNGAKAKFKYVDVPASHLKREILRILLELKFIRRYADLTVANKGVLRIWLGYNRDDDSIITGLRRVSRPGLRVYVTSEKLKRRRQTVGTMIISTSRGLMTHGQAIQEKVGGELICRIW